MLQISPLSNFRLSAAVEVLSAWKRRWIVQETFSTSRKIMCGYQNVTLPKPPWCHGEEDHIRTLELLFAFPPLKSLRSFTTGCWLHVLGYWVPSSRVQATMEPNTASALLENGVSFEGVRKSTAKCTDTYSGVQSKWSIKFCRFSFNAVVVSKWDIFKNLAFHLVLWRKSNLFAKPVFPGLQPEDTHQLCSNISKWLAAFCAPLGALPQVKFSFCQPFPRIHCCPMTGC